MKILSQAQLNHFVNKDLGKFIENHRMLKFSINCKLYYMNLSTFYREVFSFYLSTTSLKVRGELPEEISSRNFFIKAYKMIWV